MDNFTKVIKVFINILMTIILIFGILFIMLFLIGIEPFVVVSGSMSPTIEAGSLSFINKHSNYDNIKENDVIAFTASTGDKVTHRVINITDQGMETKGDRNSNSDGISTNKNNFIGKNIFSIPKLGYGIRMIQTPRGKIIIVTFAIVIFLSGFLMDDNKGKRAKQA